MNPKEIIARRVAKEFKDGDVVNLGIGLPTMVADYVSDDIEILLHSENGFVGIGPAPSEEEIDKDLVNAGGMPASIKDGGMFFDTVPLSPVQWVIIGLGTMPVLLIWPLLRIGKNTA